MTESGGAADDGVLCRCSGAGTQQAANTYILVPSNKLNVLFRAVIGKQSSQTDEHSSTDVLH